MHGLSMIVLLRNACKTRFMFVMVQSVSSQRIVQCSPDIRIFHQAVVHLRQSWDLWRAAPVSPPCQIQHGTAQENTAVWLSLRSIMLPSTHFAGNCGNTSRLGFGNSGNCSISNANTDNEHWPAKPSGEGDSAEPHSSTHGARQWAGSSNCCVRAVEHAEWSGQDGQGVGNRRTESVFFCPSIAA